MFRSFVLVCLFLSLSPLIYGDERVDVTATVTQPDANTYCVSGVCLSIHSGTTSSVRKKEKLAGTYTSTITTQGGTSTTTTTSMGAITTTTSTSTSLSGSSTYTTSTSNGHNKPDKPQKPQKPTKKPKPPKHGQDNSGTTIGYGPTQAPGEPGTVIVQKAPTCDVCKAGVFVFYMQPTCCPDGSVCDVAGLLSSGSLDLPSDCGEDGPAAITFDACTCTFYCNSTLGHGGSPTMPPTLPPTPTYEPTDEPTYQPTTLAPTYPPTTVAPTYPPTTIAPTYAPTTQAPTTPAPTTQAPTTQAPTTAAPTTKAPTTKAPTTKAPTVAPTTKAPTTVAPTVPNRGNSPTQSPTCSRCNGTHVFFVVFPVCCTNQVVSLCNNAQIADAAKHLPDNCDQNSITWDGCSCQFYCNTTSSSVPVNPSHPGNAPVLPVPQSEIPTEQVDIRFNITKPNNNTRCIAGTSICITVSSAPHTVVAFPVIASLILGLVSLL